MRAPSWCLCDVTEDLQSVHRGLGFIPRRGRLHFLVDCPFNMAITIVPCLLTLPHRHIVSSLNAIRRDFLPGSIPRHGRLGICSPDTGRCRRRSVVDASFHILSRFLLLFDMLLTFHVISTRHGRLVGRVFEVAVSDGLKDWGCGYIRVGRLVRRGRVGRDGWRHVACQLHTALAFVGAVRHRCYCLDGSSRRRRLDLSTAIHGPGVLFIVVA
jgi:hypothetical protein